jgi:phosphoglycolate phosphatase
MIGDHRNDIEAARGAGVRAIFAGWGYGPHSMAGGAPIAADVAALRAMLR